MIDRRTFLTRSSVATALTAVGVRQAGAQAASPALPAVIEPDAPIERFSGYLMTLDHTDGVMRFNVVELWFGPDGCGMTMRPDGESPGERIVFDQPQVVWGFTCMKRLMRRQARRP